jgi:hypothetical protein
MNTAEAPMFETLNHAKAVLGGEISALINPADRAMIEHMHELILAADMHALQTFVRQFTDNAEYLGLVANSAGKHFSQLVTGVCVTTQAPGVLLINAYHGDFGLLIYASGQPSQVVPIRTIWDGSIQIENGIMERLPKPEIVLQNCAATARERLKRMKAKQTEDQLPEAIDTQ